MFLFSKSLNLAILYVKATKPTKFFINILLEKQSAQNFIEIKLLPLIYIHVLKIYFLFKYIVSNLCEQKLDSYFFIPPVAIYPVPIL